MVQKFVIHLGPYMLSSSSVIVVCNCYSPSMIDLVLERGAFMFSQLAVYQWYINGKYWQRLSINRTLAHLKAGNFCWEAIIKMKQNGYNNK